MSPERDDYQDEDDREEFASRSIFAAGWFRAVLVLTVLAIVVVISLPYLLNWFEPSAPARVAKSAESLKPVPGAPSPPAVAPAPSPAPAAPIAAPPEIKSAPPVTPPPKAAIAPAPSPKAVPEKAPTKPAAEKPVTKAPPEKAPAKATTERPAAKAAETAPAKTADKAPQPSRVVAKADAPSRPSAVADAKPSGAVAPGTGNYWIQLGAFKEQKNAEALAKTLRDAGFPVQVTAIGSGGGGESKGAAQQHELFVTETSVDKVNAALKGRGTARPVSGGVAVKPAFSLQDAMTVSKRLTDEGLKVVIRPAGVLTTSPQGQGTLHAVRAGGYSNRTSALAARDELAAKGHQGFLAEGPAK